MEMTKSRILQIVMGGVSLVMLVLGILIIGQIIPAFESLWAWGIIIVCFGFIIVEVLLYFLVHSDIMSTICKWLLIFFGVILLVINTVVLCVEATSMFADFGAISGWFAFIMVLINYAICAMIIAYLVLADKEYKVLKEEQRNQVEEQPKEEKK